MRFRPVVWPECPPPRQTHSPYRPVPAEIATAEPIALPVARSNSTTAGLWNTGDWALPVKKTQARPSAVKARLGSGRAKLAHGGGPPSANTSPRVVHAPSAPPLGPLDHFIVRGWLLPIPKPTAYHLPLVGCLRTCTSTSPKSIGAVWSTKLLSLLGVLVETKCRTAPVRKFSAYRCQWPVVGSFTMLGYTPAATVIGVE